MCFGDHKAKTRSLLTQTTWSGRALVCHFWLEGGKKAWKIATPQDWVHLKSRNPYTEASKITGWHHPWKADTLSVKLWFKPDTWKLKQGRMWLFEALHLKCHSMSGAGQKKKKKKEFSKADSSGWESLPRDIFVKKHCWILPSNAEGPGGTRIQLAAPWASCSLPLSSKKSLKEKALFEQSTQDLEVIQWAEYIQWQWQGGWQCH